MARQATEPSRNDLISISCWAVVAWPLIVALGRQKQVGLRVPSQPDLQTKFQGRKASKQRKPVLKSTTSTITEY